LRAQNVFAFCCFKDRKVGEQVILMPCHINTEWTDYFVSPERPTDDFMQQKDIIKLSEREGFE